MNSLKLKSLSRLAGQLQAALATLALLVALAPELHAGNPPVDSVLISIRIQSHTLTAVPGAVDTISIVCNAQGNGIAGFDFTLAYDHESFDLIDALPGSFLDSCNWEYFMDRDNPKCPGPCPAGLYKIVALARLQDEDNAPTCFIPPDGTELARLVIRRRPEIRARTFMGVVSEPLRFFWIDCGDNSLSSVSGNDLLLCRVVSDADGAPLPQNIYTHFPNYTGPTGACLDSHRENAPKAVVKYINAVIVSPPIEFVPEQDSTGN